MRANSRFEFGRAARAIGCGVAALVSLAACDLPLGLGLPTTRELENGAAETLGSATSIEITGSYTKAATRWSVDLQLIRPDTQHVLLSTANQKLEAIIIGKQAYFRGQQFLTEHLGSDPLSRLLITAAGNAWWKGPIEDAPQLPHMTDAEGFTSAFLGPAVTQRSDHVSVDGIDAVDLAGPRAEVFLSAAQPYRPLRVVTRKGVTIDGIEQADLRFGNFDSDFGITVPTDIIDFSNLSTLPPLYTVVSVDTSRCASPCMVSALLKNLGGRQPARAPSTISFTMTDNASRLVVGRCQVPVAPDVGYNASTVVRCTIVGVGAQQVSAATVTATPDNPGRA